MLTYLNRPATVSALLLFLALALAGTAIPAPRAVGAVYVQSNSIPNAVLVFYRSATGELTPGPSVPTGGSGSTVNPPFNFPVTDSQNSVVLTQDNRVLLVTNSGSDTISSFRVLPDGNIVLADQEPSGGALPISIAVTNGGKGGGSLVYVLNENSGTVSGFTVDRQGEISAIPGSTRSVTGTFSATVGFNQSGSVLTVTNRNDAFVTPNGTISTFPVNLSTGLLGAETVTPATGTGSPFGFEYTKRDQLLVANSGELTTGLAGSASSYDLVKQTAALTPRDTEAAGGGATCWVAVTNNNKFAYFTNALTHDLTGFSIASDGQLTPIGMWSTPGNALDADTSVNSKYLYVLNTDVDLAALPAPTFNDSRVTAFKIDNSTGHLTLIGSTPAGMGGTSGLAAF